MMARFKLAPHSWAKVALVGLALALCLALLPSFALAQDSTQSPQYLAISGPVGKAPADGIGEWTIAGQKIVTDKESHLNARAKEAKAGDWAVAFVVKQSNGLWAKVLVVIGGCPVGRPVHVVGVIEKVESNRLVVSSVPITLNAEARIVGKPETGLLVNVFATMNDAGAIVARQVVVRGAGTQARAQVRKQITLTGRIEKMAGRTGEWIIDGQKLQVRETTRIREEAGKAEVGAMVRIRAEEENGVLYALEIDVLHGQQRIRLLKPQAGTGNSPIALPDLPKQWGKGR